MMVAVAKAWGACLSWLQESADGMLRWRHLESPRQDFANHHYHREARVQQDKSATPPGDGSPDSQERIQDFLARHGGCGPGTARRHETAANGLEGWYEIYAADGYCMRCEWSRMGSREELKYSEIGPHSGGSSGNRA
jgi:hypothetical protein